MFVQKFIDSPAYNRVGFQASYYPAELKKYGCSNGGWMIEYYAFNPAKRRMVCIRKKLNRIRDKFTSFQAFRIYALNQVDMLNHQLSLGWSPFEYVPTQNADAILHESYKCITENNVRPMVPITTDISTYLQSCPIESAPPTLAGCIDAKESVQDIHKDRIVDITDKFLAAKEREVRWDSMRSYKSGCTALNKYIISKKMPNMYIQDFSNRSAIDFMDYLQETKKFRNNTYNNYLKLFRAIFQWAVEQCYITENPFTKIKKKRAEEKIRTLVDPDSRKRVMDYLKEKNDWGFMLVCHLVYTSLIRPLEISYIKIGNIDFERKCIYLEGEHTKTHYSRECAISDSIIDIMKKLNIEQLPTNYYLVGKGFVPSKEIAPRASFNKQWAKVREALNLPMEMQLYSLKDTGITDMLEANIPAITVMKHADHHDLAMTERYANHKDKNLIETIRSAAPSF